MMRCPDPGRTADPVRPVKWTLRADAFGPVALGLLLWVVTPSAPVADSAMKGDVAGVRALLARGADVNAAQGDGMTALHWAAMNGGFEIAQVVIDAGADTEVIVYLTPVLKSINLLVWNRLCCSQYRARPPCPARP